MILYPQNGLIFKASKVYRNGTVPKKQQKAESGLWLFTKDTQAPVSLQVAALGLGLLLLSEDSAFFNAWVPPSCIFEFFL